MWLAFFFIVPHTHCVLCFVTRLVFTVVSDPSEDDDDEGDCVDVAYASVDFIQVCALLHCSILVLSYFYLHCDFGGER